VRAPQLQIVMVRLWDESAGNARRLTLRLLRELGGTETIIREHVDRELAGYSAAEQRVAGEMLRRMVAPSGAKIAHREADLAEFAGVPVATAAAVLGRLTSRSRIVEALDDDRYQLSHDALAVPVLEWCRRLDAKQARRRALWRLFSTVGFVGVILMALVLVDAFGPIESYTVGAAFELRGAQAPTRDVVLVGIDDATLNDHLKTELPLSRRYHADALDQIIAGRPRAVAYDLYFAKRPTSSPDYRAFAESVYGADRPIVFAARGTDHGKTDVFGGFVNDLGARAGLDAVREDAGGVVRRPLFADDGVKSLAVVTAEAARHRRISAGDVDGAWIAYRGPQGTFPVIPFWRLLPSAGAHRIPAETFRDKVVVVGVTSPADSDRHQAWGRRGEDMSGVEIHANSIATALDGYPLRDVGAVWTLLAIAALTLVAPLAALRFRLAPALALGLAAGAGYLLLAWLLFEDGRVLSVAPPMMGLILAMLAVALTGAAAGPKRVAG
jgi:CHASE2 domain-containing sensor protein